MSRDERLSREPEFHSVLIERRVAFQFTRVATPGAAAATAGTPAAAQSTELFYFVAFVASFGRSMMGGAMSPEDIFHREVRLLVFPPLDFIPRSR